MLTSCNKFRTVSLHRQCEYCSIDLSQASKSTTTAWSRLQDRSRPITHRTILDFKRRKQKRMIGSINLTVTSAARAQFSRHKFIQALSIWKVSGLWRKQTNCVCNLALKASAAICRALKKRHQGRAAVTKTYREAVEMDMQMGAILPRSQYKKANIKAMNILK